MDQQNQKMTENLAGKVSRLKNVGLHRTWLIGAGALLLKLTLYFKRHGSILLLYFHKYNIARS